MRIRLVVLLALIAFISSCSANNEILGTYSTTCKSTICRGDDCSENSIDLVMELEILEVKWNKKVIAKYTQMDAKRISKVYCELTGNLKGDNLTLSGDIGRDRVINLDLTMTIDGLKGECLNTGKDDSSSVFKCKNELVFSK